MFALLLAFALSAQKPKGNGKGRKFNHARSVEKAKKFPDLKPRQFPRSRKQITGFGVCDVCQLAITYIESVMTDITMEEVTKAVDVCKTLPIISEVCKNITEQEIEKIVEGFTQKLTSQEICSLILLC